MFRKMYHTLMSRYHAAVASSLMQQADEEAQRLGFHNCWDYMDYAWENTPLSWPDADTRLQLDKLMQVFSEHHMKSSDHTYMAFAAGRKREEI